MNMNDEQYSLNQIPKISMQQILNAGNETFPRGKQSFEPTLTIQAPVAESAWISLIIDVTNPTNIHSVFMTCRLKRQNAAKSFFSPV